jgi:regulator of replication initiation timing
MSYQSSEAKKEEFRKYLEKSNVIDALTKVLVNLYEEPEKPDKPVEFIKKALGGPSPADFEALQAENAQLRAENEALKKRISDQAPPAQ